MYKVFIVDDEPFIIEGLYDIVDWAGMGMEIVGRAENGQEALEALTSLRADILITDISMPLMNGLDLIRAVRKLQPGMKVIILSGYDEFGYLKEGMTLGIENYLLKPINLEEFKATLSNTVEKLHMSRVEDELNAQSISILRDNIMHRWLREQIGANEFRERSELLGIQLDKPLLLAALLRPGKAVAGGEFLKAVSDALGDSRSAILFQDMEGDTVLLHGLSEYQRGKEEVDRCHERLAMQLPSFHPLRFSLGSVVETEGGAALSYAQAKKAQEYFMLFPERTVIRYEEIEHRSEAGGREVTLNWEQMQKLILAKDKEGLLERIDERFEQLRHMEGVTPEILQDFSMEWMIRFKMQVKEIRHSEEPEIYQEGFRRLRETTSIHEWIHILKEAAALTIDLLIRDVKSPVVQQVLNFIHESYAEDISLKTLGAQFNIHPVYLGQLFSKEVGDTFTEYINRYRIEKAKEQLRGTSSKVHEIARNVGYWETGYFYKQFKKYVGISPTEYKGLV
ncbi:response regulator transcription factor [Paenibacillus sonchi]|uniref:response regulator transcription factor n=1 Tax=Paenibacillus sonchi TaxID=373687 RepID=UPI001E527AF0|nr:response regulator transcription factor [Paenibacillus sonchi]MCE3198849.1 response regulator transcription factor [Paenibacillus sonchi]